MIFEIWNELSAYSIHEITAVLASLTYVVLAAKNNRYCWPAAFIGSAIYAVIFWQHQLLMDAALNSYYVLMAIYGWLLWNRTDAQHSDKIGNQSKPIQRWHIKSHLLAVVGVLTLSLISGYWLANHSQASFPYIDSFTTWASLLATWMMAKRVLESWLYWIVIDAISIYLYINKELVFTTLLFGIYCIIAAYGYFYWRRLYKGQSQTMTNLPSRYAVG